MSQNTDHLVRRSLFRSLRYPVAVIIGEARRSATGGRSAPAPTESLNSAAKAGRVGGYYVGRCSARYFSTTRGTNHGTTARRQGRADYGQLARHREGHSALLGRGR